MFGPQKKDFKKKDFSGNTCSSKAKLGIPRGVNFNTFLNFKDSVSNEKLAIKKSKIKEKEYGSILNTLNSKYKKLSEIKNDHNYLNILSLIARASLILADHEISAKDYDFKGKGELMANSKRVETSVKSKKKKKGVFKKIDEIKIKIFPKQPLSYHLKNVSKRASEIVGCFNENNNNLPALDYYNYENLLMSGDPNSRFAWQDKAVDFLRKYKDKQTLVFNVASTGSGKTFMNFKTLLTLKEEKPVRISSVLNLRSLTLQTHNSYKKDLQLSDNECVCVIGDLTIKKLHEISTQDEEIDYNDVEIEASTTNLQTNIPAWLEDLGKQKKGSVKEVIGAPVLVSTIDYLIAAGEPYKQAHHSIALLRASTSDVIIDEIDSYDTKALISVLRLITIHAMMGRNVVVSSATLMPESADAITMAFNTGVAMRKSAFMDTESSILAISDSVDPEELSGKQNNYQEYCKKLAEKSSGSSKKIFKIVEVNNSIDNLYKILPDCILDLHKKNNFSLSDSSYENISIGLVRVANIKPCMNIAKKIKDHFLNNDDYDVRVCAYHAKEVLSKRFYKEYHLDKILNRKNKDNPNINIENFINDDQKFKPKNKKNLILIVVATPVEEVGRDHDFDWAIIEPSSMHSIIQTAGRVNRHRLKTVKQANIVLLQHNIKYLEQKNKGRGFFNQPGFEIRDNDQSTHNNEYDLTKLLYSDNLKKEEVFKENQLNYKYIFSSSDQPRCNFAKYDALSIKKQVDTVKDILTFENPLWASKWFGETFPLRSRQNNETFYFKNNGVELKLYRVMPKNINDVLIGGKEDNNDLENTFLSPTIKESLDFINGIDKTIKTESVTTFSLYANESIDNININWQGVRTIKK